MNYTNKPISTLEVNGNFIKETTEISKAKTNFYKNLYSERLNEHNDNYQKSIDEFLTINEMRKLNNDEKTFCDRPICEAHILKSIKNYPQAKLLFPMVYQLNFTNSSDVISNIHLPNVYINVMEKGELTIEQKGGIITLLPKKGKNIELLKDWRPIKPS